jgi:hypothetical protein
MDEEIEATSDKKPSVLDKITFPQLLAGLVSALIVIMASLTLILLPKADASIKVEVDPLPEGAAEILEESE